MDNKVKEYILGTMILIFSPALIMFAVLWLIYAMLKAAIRNK
jgi:hypothetical protein